MEEVFKKHQVILTKTKTVHFPSQITNSHIVLSRYLYNGNTSIKKYSGYFSSKNTSLKLGSVSLSKSFADFDQKAQVISLAGHVRTDLTEENNALRQFQNLKRLVIRSFSETVTVLDFPPLENLKCLVIDLRLLSLWIKASPKRSWLDNVLYLEVHGSDEIDDQEALYQIRHKFPNIKYANLNVRFSQSNEGSRRQILPDSCQSLQTNLETFSEIIPVRNVENFCLIIDQPQIFKIPSLPVLFQSMTLKILNIIILVPRTKNVETFEVYPDVFDFVYDFLESQSCIEVVSIRFSNDGPLGLSPKFKYNYEYVDLWASMGDIQSLLRTHRSLKMLIIGNQFCFISQWVTANLLRAIEEFDEEYDWGIRGYGYASLDRISFDLLSNS